MDEFLRYYFQKGFSYKNMLLFLSKYHDTEMRNVCAKSSATIAWHGIKTKKYFLQHPGNTTRNSLNGLGCSGGYRLHWRGPQVERYSSTTTSGGRALSRTRPCWLSWKKGSPPTEGPVYESCRINWNHMVFLYMGVLTDSVKECFG